MKTLLTIILLLVAVSVQAATISCVTIKSTGAIYTPDGVNYACGNSATAVLTRLNSADYEVRSYTEFANINGYDTATIGSVKTRACKKLTAEEKAALGCP